MSRLPIALLILAACAVGPAPPTGESSGEASTAEASTGKSDEAPMDESTDESTAEAPTGDEAPTTGETITPCLCDLDEDGRMDEGTCLAVDTCGRVCDDGAPCPAGVPADVPICFKPCVVGDDDTCGCLALHPGGRTGWCFTPPACLR